MTQLYHQLYSFREKYFYPSIQQQKTKQNIISSKTKTKMEIQQKMHQMDTHIQKRLLLQLSLSKDQELFNQCKVNYLKKIMSISRRNYEDQVSSSGMHEDRSYFREYQGTDLKDQFKEYIDNRSQVIFDYLQSQIAKKQKENTIIGQNSNNKSGLNSLANNQTNFSSGFNYFKINSCKNSQKKQKCQKSLQRHKITKSFDLNERNNDKSAKNIRYKCLSKIKNQILQNQTKLFDATSMLQYGFKTYDESAYTQQKRLKSEIALKICKSITNLKRKTRKNY